LLGETPADCWDRLAEDYGVFPPAAAIDQIAVFGQRHERIVSGKGVRFLGVDYSSPELMSLFLSTKRAEVSIRVDPENMGWIAYWSEGSWKPAYAIQDCFDKVTIREWIKVVQHLRQKYSAQAEFYTDAIFHALKKIRKVSTDALMRAGVEAWEITTEQVERAEHDLCIGIRIAQSDHTIEPAENRGALLGHRIDVATHEPTALIEGAPEVDVDASHASTNDDGLGWVFVEETTDDL
jgi:putative transposase